MDWKTFIVEIFGTLAWPAVILILSFHLKDNIGELILRLKKLKHKDTELEFSETINELVTERDSQPEDEKITDKQNLEGDENYNFLVKLSDISPRSAVQEAFRALENSAYNALARMHPKIYSSGIKKPHQLLSMLRGDILSPQQYHEFKELKKLRNGAAHDPEFELRGMPIEAYVDIAITLARRLDECKP